MKIRYCDGASFAGNSIFDNGVNMKQFSHLVFQLKHFQHLRYVFRIYGQRNKFFHDLIFHFGLNKQTSLLYYRGQRIWEAIILDLLPKGLSNAKKVILCSRGYICLYIYIYMKFCH